MLLARFKVGEDIHFGVLEGSSIRIIEGSIFHPEFILTNRCYNLNQVRLLGPCQPSKIIATGTPSGVGAMKVGDEVEVFIQDIGSLKNRVIKRYEG